MALKAFLDSNYWLAACSRAPDQVTGGFARSLNCDNSLQKDEQFQAVDASCLNASSGNLPSSVARIAHLSAGMASRETNSTVLQNSENLKFSTGASYLVRDTNSEVSKDPRRDRYANSIVDSYPNLPSSSVVLSHDSCNSQILPMVGSYMVQQTSYSHQNSSQLRKRKWQQRDFTVTSDSELQNHDDSLLDDMRKELCTSTLIHKKPRLDIEKDAIPDQSIARGLLECQDSEQLQSCIQQHKLQSQKQEKMVSVTHLQKDEMKRQQHWIRHYLEQQAMSQVPSGVQPFDGGLCSRRLMQYMYHLQCRPFDNDIAYWRKFVAEYYTPSAKKRWCLSLYDNVGCHALGVFPQAAMDAWQCDICGSKSGRGFEAFFEVLPRLNKLTFESGVIDEIWFFDLPHEYRFLSGLTMLEYGKAIQESVYKDLSVVCKGKLRIIFTHDLKILSWEFCAHRHEELLPQCLVAPQVNQLAHAVQKYQSAIDGNGHDEVSTHDLQASCNVLLAAGCKLEKNLELRLVGDLGFSKRYIRCLQIADTINNMKGLMTFSWDNKIGPIESLKNYPRRNTVAKLPKDDLQEKERVKSAQGLSTDSDKLMATTPVLRECSDMTKFGHLTSSEKAVLAIPGYHRKLLQDSLSSNLSKEKEEPSCSDSSSKQNVSSKAFHGLKTFSPGPILNLPRFTESTTSQSTLGRHNCQDSMIQKLLQEMVNNRRAVDRGDAEKVNYEISRGEVSGLPTRASGVDVGNSRAGAANHKVNNSMVTGLPTGARTDTYRNKMIFKNSTNSVNHQVNNSSIVAGSQTGATGAGKNRNGVDFENNGAAAASPGDAKTSLLWKMSATASGMDTSMVCGNDTCMRGETELYLPKVMQSMVRGYYEK